MAISEDEARKLAPRCTVEQVEGWWDYVQHSGEGLRSKTGFLISKLRVGEMPPAIETYRELTFHEELERIQRGVR